MLNPARHSVQTERCRDFPGLGTAAGLTLHTQIAWCWCWCWCVVLATQVLPRVDKQGNVLSSFGEGHSLAHAADEREERLQQLQQGHSDEQRDTQAFGRRVRALLGMI